MAEYINTPVYELSSTMMDSTMYYKSLDRTLVKIGKILHDHNDEYFPLTLRYYPNSTMERHFDEETQSISEAPTQSEMTAFERYIADQPYSTPAMMETISKAVAFYGESTAEMLIKAGVDAIACQMAQAEEYE